LGRSWILITNFRFIKPGLFKAMGDSQSRFMIKESKPEPFLCREAIEEQTLAGHF
jgi:hypothetical protein